MRLLVVSLLVFGGCRFSCAQQIGWQFRFAQEGFAQAKYGPEITKGQGHYVLEHGYLSNIQQEFAPLAIADFPCFGIRARNVKGGIFV